MCSEHLFICIKFLLFFTSCYIVIYMLYASCSLHYFLCIYVLVSFCSQLILSIPLYGSYNMNLVICLWVTATCHSILTISFYTSHSMHPIICIRRGQIYKSINIFYLNNYHFGQKPKFLYQNSVR